MNPATADDLLVLDRPGPTEGLSFVWQRESYARSTSHVVPSATYSTQILVDQEELTQGTWWEALRPVSAFEEALAPSASQVFDEVKFRLARRLRMLKRLPHNHDGEGASAAIAGSVDSALAFLWKVNTQLRYGATLDDEGRAVFEFEDAESGLFADLTFLGDPSGGVECYLRRAGAHSQFIAATLKSAEVKSFLQEAGITA